MSTTAATYSLNLHCPECAHRIKGPLLRTPGIHTVDVNFEKGEVKVIGVIDSKKIHQRIETIGKRKVQIIKVEPNFKETIVVEKIVKEIKEPIFYSTTIKTHLHCHECERHLCNKLLRRKGIYNVKSDMKAQTLTIEGSTEVEKLVSFIKDKVGKHAEIVSTRQVVKKEAKEAVKQEREEKKKEVENVTVIPKVVDVREVKESAQKLIHCVYAPQWFSDEDPNSCAIL